MATSLFTSPSGVMRIIPTGIGDLAASGEGGEGSCRESLTKDASVLSNASRRLSSLVETSATKTTHSVTATFAVGPAGMVLACVAGADAAVVALSRGNRSEERRVGKE